MTCPAPRTFTSIHGCVLFARPLFSWRLLHGFVLPLPTSVSDCFRYKVLVGLLFRDVRVCLVALVPAWTPTYLRAGFVVVQE